MESKIRFDYVKSCFEKRGYILLNNKYKNAFGKLYYICPQHSNEIREINWNKFQQGHGCKECGYKRVSNILSKVKRKPFETVYMMFKEQNLQLLTTQDEYYASDNPILSFVCWCSPDKIQHKAYKVFLQYPYCSLCLKRNKQNIRIQKGYDEFLNRCQQKNYIPLSSIEEYQNVLSPLKYMCPIHGVQTTNLSHLRENKGCIKCGYDKMGQKLQLSLEEVNKRLILKETILVSEYTNLNDIHKFSCIHHNNYVFEARLRDVLYSDVKCPLCHESKGEKAIRMWLEQHNVIFKSQQKFPDLFRYNNRNRLSYDFFIPINNMLIEYQGQFHDGTAWQQNEEQFIDQQKKDRMKREYAYNHGYQLLEIWYWDYKNINKILSEVLL